MSTPRPVSTELPPGQQLAAADRWPVVGERAPGAVAGPWTVSVAGEVERSCVVTVAELAALPQVDRVVDIHCVTRWSKPRMPFRGVPLAALVEGALPTPAARYVSFVAASERNHSTSLPLADALQLDALLALSAAGRPLDREHGGPVRVVVPGRYFYKSLKWLARIELLAADRLGFWEATAGYHNTADPWQEQRYLAPELSRAQARHLLAARDVRGRHLRGLRAAGLDLAGLRAEGATLRDADFRGCRLRDACFDRANLSNAHFDGANLCAASFQGADLEGAAFEGADLAGARLHGASLVGTSFCDVSAGMCARPARLDGATRFDPDALHQLTPDQQRYLLRALADARENEQ